MEGVQQICSDKEREQPLVPALKNLRDLLASHFDFEESFMGSINLPDRQEHARKHLELMAAIDECLSAISPATSDGSLGLALRGKISDHLLEYDVKMGKTIEHLVAQVRDHEVGEKR
jgi:hemerythrin